MAASWDDETIFKLIETFESKRILWDCATWSKDYKNKLKKNEAWDDIAKSLGLTKQDVESKMHTLRSQYARERKKIQSLQTTGVADTEISKWKFYDALRFLPSGTTKSSTDAMVKPGHLNEILEVELTDASMTSTPSSPERHIHASSSNDKKRRADDGLGEVLDIIKSAKRKMDEYKDEFDIYGQYVASELRQTRDEVSVVHAKSLINNVLTDMRKGKFKYMK